MPRLLLLFWEKLMPCCCLPEDDTVVFPEQLAAELQVFDVDASGRSSRAAFPVLSQVSQVQARRFVYVGAPSITLLCHMAASPSCLKGDSFGQGPDLCRGKVCQAVRGASCGWRRQHVPCDVWRGSVECRLKGRC